MRTRLFLCLMAVFIHACSTFNYDTRYFGDDLMKGKLVPYTIVNNSEYAITCQAYGFKFLTVETDTTMSVDEFIKIMPATEVVVWLEPNLRQERYLVHYSYTCPRRIRQGHFIMEVTRDPGYNRFLFDRLRCY